MYCFVFWVTFPQIKYKESGKKELSSSLYHTLPDTLETAFAREVTDMLSEVKKSSESRQTRISLLKLIISH